MVECKYEQPDEIVHTINWIEFFILGQFQYLYHEEEAKKNKRIKSLLLKLIFSQLMEFKTSE